jgi:hypothetical protein
MLETMEDAPVFIRRSQSRWDARAVVAAAAEEAELGDKAPAERKIPARRANLGDSILLSAVEDYMGDNERNHLSAAKLLYPTDPYYVEHLRWVCGLTSLPMHHLRATLDRLRPIWNAERRNLGKKR